MPHYIPRPLCRAYHYLLALVGAALYRFPARSLTVIGITGTKGKTTVSELITAILEEAGYTVALANGVRFKISSWEERNLSRMTMPGRFFLQRFLRRALSRGATHAVIEMTSEGAAQHRHRFLALDALVFTNLAPEHIESHGSYEAYRDAKLSIARSLANSPKRQRVMVANADDEAGSLFLAAVRAVRSAASNGASPARPCPYSLKDAEPYEIKNDGIAFTFDGHLITSPLVGVFNLSNILAAATLAKGISIETEIIACAIASFA
ncbi:MAG: Mur ligase family protein, partial [Patescibacteria group bacterium]|nr:Mur ligase family protein [Patescibacteria group bacterium]